MPLLAPFVQRYLIAGHDDPASSGIDTWVSPGGYATVSINIGTATSTVGMMAARTAN